MNISQLESSKLIDIVSLLEDDRFQRTMIPILSDAEDSLFEQMLQDADKCDYFEHRGGIKRLRWLVGLHDVALDELRERRLDGSSAPKEEITSEDT